MGPLLAVAFLALTGGGEAAAAEGEVEWSWTSGVLTAADRSGRLLLERPMPATTGEPELAPLPGGRRAWVAAGELLLQLDLSGEIVHGHRLPEAALDLALVGDRLWVAGARTLLEFTGADGVRLAVHEPGEDSPREALARLRAAAEPRDAAIPWLYEAAPSLAGFSPIEGTGGAERTLDRAEEPPGPIVAAATSCSPQFADGLFPATGLASEIGFSTSAGATAVFDDGNGPALYLGGKFHYADGRRVDHLARWDGSTWRPVGPGFDGAVAAVVVHDDGSGPALYAAGEFTKAGTLQVNGIARWDGTAWQRVGYGFNDRATDLVVHDDGSGPALYAAGIFTRADHGTGWYGTYLGVTVPGIARWDGERWRSLPGDLGGIFSPTRFGVFDDGQGARLWVGALDGIWVWDGSAMVLESAATSSPVSYAVFDDGTGADLYASLNESFFEDPSLAFRVLKRSGGSWTTVGAFASKVGDLSLFETGTGPGLFVGGDFTALPDGSAASNLAVWDGFSWTAPPSAGDLPVSQIGIADLGAGVRLLALTGASRRLAAWDGLSWTDLSGTGGLNGPVAALTVFDDGTGPALVAGGSFSASGSTPLARIGRWTATGWTPLGGGPGGTVDALAVLDDGSGPFLYATVQVPPPSGVGTSTGRVAGWNGVAWSPVGGDLGGVVRALAVYDDGSGPALYAGGSFLWGLLRWDGAEWTPVGGGVSGSVYALTVFDDGTGSALVAGGDFTAAGGVAASRIARWDGAAWSALGSGANSTVRALTVHDDGSGPALYAGGAFTQAGGLTALRVARWATSWSSVSSKGLGSSSVLASDAVHVLAVHDDGNGPSLYAGGTFQVSGTTSVQRIARLSGSTWVGIGEGASATVSALASFDDGGGPALFLGGVFESAGGRASGRMARLSRPASCPGEGVPPVLTIAAPPDGTWTSSPTQLFLGSVSEPAAVTANGLPVPVASDLTFSHGPIALSEGLNRFAWFARDAANATGQLTTSLTLDSRPPSVAIERPIAGSQVFSGRPAVSVRFGDEGFGVDPETLEILADGQPLPADCTVRVDRAVCVPAADLPAGPVVLAARIADGVGQVGVSAPVTVTVAPSAGVTALSGRVVRADGSGAAGARVSVLGIAGATISAGADGTFTLAAVPVASSAPLTVVAELAEAGQVLSAVAPAIVPVAGGTTLVGTLVLGAACPPEFAADLFPGFGVSGGTAPRVHAFAVWDDGSGPKLYVGGEFTHAGGVPSPNLAAWDGVRWSAVGSGTNGRVRALAVHDDGAGPELYLGGAFTTAGGVAAVRIARFDGAGFAPLGSGVGNEVYALSSYQEAGAPALAVGGAFTTAGGATVPKVARWQGGAWSPLGAGTTGGTVHAFAVFDDGSGPALYAGGSLTRLGGTTVRQVARWTGAEWVPLGVGVGSGATDSAPINVAALAVFDDGSGVALYAAGLFAHAGDALNVHSIARWDGERWSAVGSGVTASGFAASGPQGVQALAVFDDGAGAKLFAAGEITAASGAAVSHVAAWDGSSWRSVGSGFDAGGYGGMALAVFDGGSGPRLVAGGGFTAAGGRPAPRIASWDGTVWSPVGRGMDGAVNAFAVWDDGTGPALYVAGEFKFAASGAAAYLARWDGTSWSDAGGGTNGVVSALAVYDDGGGAELYATGDFTTAGGLPAARIARFDGTAWSALGSGLPARGRALTVYDEGSGPRLFVGGDFTTAGGVAASRIARWDGTAFSALGAGVNNSVYALTVYADSGGPALWVGGSFTASGGVTTGRARIARWRAGSWAGVGNGASSGTVFALAVHDDGGGPGLYLGGNFTRVGSVNVNRAARWRNNAWAALGSGLNSTVYALASYDDGEGPALYAGGLFASAGGQSAARLARWRAGAWQPLAAGANGEVRALAVTSVGPASDRGRPTLLAGGTLTLADLRPSAYLAAWRRPLTCGPPRDTLPPFLDFTAPAAGSVLPTARPLCELSWSDTGSGVDPSTLALTVDGATRPFTCTLGADGAACTPTADLAEGSRTLGATVADVAGNPSLPATRTVVVDTQPPVLAFTAPADGAILTAVPFQARMTFADGGSGVDPASFHLQGTSSVPVTFACQVASDEALCSPTTPVPEGPFTLTASIADLAGRNSGPVARSFAVDLAPPALTIVSPAEGSFTNDTTPALVLAWSDAGAGVDPSTLALTAGGAPLAATCQNEPGGATCVPDVPFAEGPVSVAATVADFAGRVSAAAGVGFTVDSQAPAAVDLSRITVGSVAGGNAPVAGSAGAVLFESGLTVEIANPARTATVFALPGSDGSFAAEIAAAGADSLALTAVDAAGNRSAQGFVTVPGLPPGVAPPAFDPTVAYDLCAVAGELWYGPGAAQTGVSVAFDCRRVAIVRGRVLNRAGAPLAGFDVEVVGKPTWGTTSTRSDGGYDLVVEGGGEIVLRFTSEGYLPADRRVSPRWRDQAFAPDVALVSLDTAAVAVDLASPTVQVARGSQVTDGDGSRQATLIFGPGTTATVTPVGAAPQPVSSLTVRATEYTVGESGFAAMPAPLPPTSAYTYAVELSADEAGPTGRVEFSRPVPVYLENFLDFPVGTRVPSGYYDRTATRWVASPDGRVVAVLGVTAGRADLDLDGSGQPAGASALAALGIEDAEREALAGLYPVGQSLWRVPVTHFTPYDFNLPMRPEAGGEAPNLDEIRGGDADKADCNHLAAGSLIECETQILGEGLGVAGTPFSLHYRSDRVPGRTVARTLEIPLAGTSVAGPLQQIELEVEVAGRRFADTFPALPDQSTTFQWDGLDSTGRRPQGAQRTTVRVGYTYESSYTLPDPTAPGPTFGLPGGPVLTQDPARREVTLWQTLGAELGSWDAAAAAGLGGWTLSAHHSFDPFRRVLYLGTGERRSVRDAKILTVVAGDGRTGVSGDGGPAERALLANPDDLAVAPDGSVVFVDFLSCRVRRIDAEGTIETVAGTDCPGPEAVPLGDGGPATAAVLRSPSGVGLGPDGSLYIADTGHHVVRRVDPAGIVTTVAGWAHAHGGSPGSTPATDFTLFAPRDAAVGPDGALYFASQAVNGAIYRVDLASGSLALYAGGGTLPPFPERWTFGAGGPAKAAWFSSVRSIAFGPDGDLYFVENLGNSVLRVKADGILEEVAGGWNGTTSVGYEGDGGPATEALFNNLQALSFAPDGSLLVADTGNHAIRRIDTAGRVTTVAGTGFAGDDLAGGPAQGSRLSSPFGVEARPDGSVLVSDTNNQRLRQIEDALPGEPPSGSQLILVPAEQGGVRYVFDNFGRHLRTEDTATGTVLLTFGYAPSGLLASATDAFGNATTVERDPGGTATAIVGPDGHRTTLTVGAPGGYLSAVENPEGERVGLAYTPDGLLTRLTGPRNFDTTFTWDALGRLERDTDPLGGATILSRTELAATEEVSGGWDAVRESVLGRRTTYRTERKRAGELVRTVTDPVGRVTVTVEGKDGSTRTTSPDGTVTEVTEGPDSRYGMAAPILSRGSVQTPSGLMSTSTATQTLVRRSPLLAGVSPNDPANLISRTDSLTVDGRTTTSTYDFATRRLTVTTPLGRASEATQDVYGRLVEARQPGVAPVAYGYDARGRLASATQGGRSVLYDYDAQGFLATTTDPLGRQTSWSYDAVGRPVTQTLPDGRVVGFSYDSSGNLTSITPPGRPAHGFAYDADDQAQSATPPDLPGGPWAATWTYNLDHQVELITRPDGRTIDPAYDPATGRLSNVVTPRGTTSYAYHPTSGKVTSISDPAGGSLAFTYDGPLTTGVTWAGEVSGSLTYSYNDHFEPIRRTINGGHAIDLAYDLDGSLTQAGDLTLGYDAATGLPTTSTLGSVTDEATWSSFGELATYTARFGASDLIDLGFTRDQLGRITGKNETAGGQTAAWSYDYDLAGRLIEVKRDGAIVEQYAYDANSNRTSWTDPWGTGTATYDAQDRLLTYGDKTYTYTAAGDLATKSQNAQTVVYDYDVTGALLGVTLADGIEIDYVLDALGRRVGKKVDGTLVRGWLYEGGRPVAELDGAGAVVATFVYGRKPVVPDVMVKAGVTYRILSDAIGSVRFVVDAATGEIAQRIDYSAFGRVTFDSNPGFQPFGFAGGHYDPQTGLVRFGARDYDPETGRWTTRDPIGFAGGDTNLYGYVVNDPINLSDPSGLSWADAGKGFVEGLVVGVVVGAVAVGAVAVAPAAAPLLVIAGILGMATAGLEAYSLSIDPCATAAEKHRFVGQMAGGIVGGGLGVWGAKGLGLGAVGKLPTVSTEVGQKQFRHILGRSEYRGGGYLNSLDEAQAVLDAYHSGQATFLGETQQGFPVIRYDGVTGTNVNPGAGFPSQPTNVFIIKGTASPSVVPTSPNWTTR